ncbi:MAG: lamin tail domain-containing protein [Tannerella sp.]|jgi:roadblock/LC7 domain-containing protein|nr:lamin tail domain-containing protein [Tannerella sp.]
MKRIFLTCSLLMYSYGVLVHAEGTSLGDVIISEVMANPVGLTDLPETEYVEIFNASGEDLYLNGWTFVYGSTVVPLPEATLPAGSYAVLYRAGRDIFVESGGLDIPVAAFPSNLANTGRTLKIVNSLGLTIDSVDYAAATPARAWERDAAGDFYLSNDPRGGTPGAANSPKDIPPPSAEPDTSNPGDMIISEVMANPMGLTDFPETEYVEIFNASGEDLSLNGWTFVYGNTVVPLPEATLPTGSYAVLYRAGRDIFVESGGLDIPVAAFPSSLVNTGRTLKIVNSLGITIDSVDYAAATPARAWERDAAGDFYLSNDPRGGTPGAANSPKDIPPPDDPLNPDMPAQYRTAFEGEIVFNEILPEPFEGGSEYIELYNRSEHALSVFDLAIATRKSDGALNTRYPLSSIIGPILPDGYIVLTSGRDGVLNFYAASVGQVVYEVRLPILNNTGSTLVLLSVRDGTVIDEVSYSSKWHDMAIKNTKGVALERIDPDAAGQDATNWTSAISTVGYGTPGYRNSQARQGEATFSFGLPEYLTGTNEYRIAYRTDQAGYRCHIRIFTLEGMMVAEIANNQLLGADGEIYWNGCGSDGSRLRAGLYIYHAELYHPYGQHRTVKKAFLVRP